MRNISPHEEILKRAGSRITSGRIALMDVLDKASKPLSIETIARHMPATSQVNLATIYRIVKSLTEAGVIRGVELRHGHAHYELVDAAAHHHHFVCDRCGTVSDLNVAKEQKIIASLARQYGFSVRDHSLELFGLCRKCRRAAPR